MQRETSDREELSAKRESAFPFKRIPFHSCMSEQKIRL